jgi:fumarate reductase flavoprotein subunit
MNRFARVALLLVSTALLVPAGSPEAAETETGQAGKTLLADLHKAAYVECTDCHGKGKAVVVDDGEKQVNFNCVVCHGDLAKVAEKGKEKGHVNAHSSHLGQINCTACHHGHERSEAYCNKCHAFDMPMAGGDAEKKTPPGARKAGIHRIESTDVVVVGAGAAGMTAAITAHDLGVKVILLEKQPIPGGNSGLSAGGMNAAGTAFQEAKGIRDTPELMFEDTMKGGKNINDPELVRVLAGNSAGSVAWLTSIGADVSDVGRMGGTSVNRAHRPTGGATIGPHLTGVLKKNVADRKMDLRVNSKVVGLRKDKAGRITGVVVEGRHSGTYTIKARAVVFTAGGFSANAGKVASLRPEFAGMTTSNQPGATGDGMDIGEKAGAALVDMKEIQIHPTVAAGSRILISESVRGNGAILVNREGKRFVNELTTRDKASEAVLKQTGGSAFMIFDEGVRRSLKQIDGYFALGLVKEGATPLELGKALGMPGEALAQTIEAYNNAVDTKNDAEFKRPDMPRALRTPDYYAIEVKPGIHYTMGGLKIDAATRVIGANGKPMPGFFAAGEVTGGVHGANRLGGNSICETITFGRIAGENAAKTAKGGKVVVPKPAERKEMKKAS